LNMIDYNLREKYGRDDNDNDNDNGDDNEK